MPEEYDVAIVEGAVTTDEHVELLRSVRDTAARGHPYRRLRDHRRHPRGWRTCWPR